VSADGLGNLLSHAHHWIEGGHRFLENHRNSGTTKAAHLFGPKSQQILLSVAV
jgi:hypothetical protein